MLESYHKIRNEAHITPWEARQVKFERDLLEKSGREARIPLHISNYEKYSRNIKLKKKSHYYIAKDLQEVFKVKEDILINIFSKYKIYLLKHKITRIEGFFIRKDIASLRNVLKNNNSRKIILSYNNKEYTANQLAEVFKCSSEAIRKAICRAKQNKRLPYVYQYTFKVVGLHFNSEVYNKLKEYEIPNKLIK